MIEAWWGSLTTALQVYYAIAVVTSMLLLLQLVMMLVGLDHGDADGDVAVDGDAGVHIFSVRAIVAFFTGFGWGGVVALRGGLSLPASILVSVLVGGALMGAVFLLMRTLYGLRYSGTLDYRNAIGHVGDVYLPVPGGMSGPGQVEVLVQGRLQVVRAFTRSPEKIPNRTPVRVVDVIDQQTLVVEPLDADPASEKE